MKTSISLTAILLYLCTFKTTIVLAQNLVPNPSFEQLKTAPNCDVSVSKTVFENTIYDWFMPTSGTPDIYSTLLPNSCAASQPNSTATFYQFPTGHQLPRTGNFMAGFAPYISQWYREYMAVKLTSPLVVGQAYCCKMYVSLAEGCEYDQNDIGMYFSETYTYQSSATTLPFQPQVIEHNAIDDSINWVEIKGGFIAQTAAQYLFIGNFDSNAGSGQNYLKPGSAAFSYYYLDDVSVEATNPPPLIITGNNKVCPGAPLQINASGWDNITWYDKFNRKVSDNATLNIAHATQTSYTAKGYFCDILFSQSINTSLNPIPSIDLGKDKFICRNGSLLLDAGPTYSSYTWQDGSTNETYLAKNKGNFSVQISNAEGCYNSDTIRLIYYPNPALSLGNDIETCTGVGTISAENNLPFQHYIWQDGSTASTFNYTQAGTYWVTVSNPCSVSVTDTVHVSKIDLFIPNLITPNQDGLNDEFIIKGPIKSKGELEIYNCYGAKIYSNEKYNNSWSGENLSEGVYYYLFKYPSCKDTNGWVQLIR